MKSFKSIVFLLLLLCINLLGQDTYTSDLNKNEFHVLKKALHSGQPVGIKINSGKVLLKARKSNLINNAFLSVHRNIAVYNLYNDELGIKGFAVVSDESLRYSILNNGDLLKGEYNSKEECLTVNKEIFENDMLCETKMETPSQKTPLLSKRSNLKIGDHKKIYRLAVVTTGEFYEFNTRFGLNPIESVLWAIGTTNLVFLSDLSIEFQLDDRIHIFENSNTDPFTPVIDNPSAPGRTDQSVAAISDIFDVDEYDIGLTLNYATDGWPGGGVAYLTNACRISDFFGNVKAGNWASAYTGIDYRFVGVICHELGHSFSARHTMNSGGDNCKDAVSATEAYEIGGGHSIMAYKNACEDGFNTGDGSENLYFHTKTIEEIHAFSEHLECGEIVNLNNDIPTLDINPCNVPKFQIPLNTPFLIEASATDSDQLGYIWEQIDEDGEGMPNLGFIDDEAANSTTGPLFRNYPISTSPRRVFNNTNPKSYMTQFERLPNVPRFLNFACTVRDFHEDGGAVVSDVIQIEVRNIPEFKVSLRA